MMSELQEALYEAFALSDEIQEEMERSFVGLGVTADLKKLSWAGIETLENHTWLYSTPVLKYVLPRWLKLFSEGACPSWQVSELTLWNVLISTEWTQWPSHQVEAVRCVFREWSEEAMKREKMEEFVAEIGQLETEVAPYLDPWLRARPLEVARWIEKQSWLRVKPVVLRWATQLKVEDKLEAAFWANPDGEHAALFSRSIETVRSMRHFSRTES